jgi:predicted transposase/invertase (TIGR01784 family)
MEMQNLSAKYDIVFKRIFGDERNADILQDFLSTILELPSEEFEHIEYLPNELSKDQYNDKLGILDVRVRTKAQVDIDIEIQVRNIGDMAERSLFYWSKMFIDEIKENAQYEQLNRTIAINIVDFDMFHYDSSKYHSTFFIREKETNVLLTDKFRIDFLELKKARSLKLVGHDKKLEWMYFIGTESGNKEVLNMLSERNENIGKAAGVLMKLSADEKFRFEALAREKAIRDETSRIASAKKEGKLEGERDARMEIARNLISLGLPIDSIMKTTGLSEEEIKGIKEI